MMRQLTIAALLFSCLPAALPAATIRVPADQPTIQAGIDAAANGDTVLVADGTWTGAGNRDLDMDGKAITVRSANGPEACVIDCAGSAGDPHTGFFFEQGEGTDSIVLGFTIINGYDSSDGGVIRCIGSSPTIRDCFISDNAITGITCEDSSAAVIERCTITRGQYSGILAVNASPRISRCTVSDNYGSGGILCGNDCSPVISDCEITGNFTYIYGGGIYFEGGSLTVFNCLIAGNITFEYDGGGIYCPYADSAEIVHCTIADNTADEGWGGIMGGVSTTVTSCILWDNSNGDIGGDPVVTYSDVADGYPGTGNISIDPLFIAGPTGAYYLAQIAAGQLADSPCLDSGDPAAGPPWGSTRTDQQPDTGLPDMGYHYPITTVDASITCSPAAGTLPFSTTMTVILSNTYPEWWRRISGRIDLDLAGGRHISSWRSGYTNVAGGGSATVTWNQALPALGSLVGDNTFSLFAEDTTPAPYNLAPYPSAGDTDTGGCTVTGMAP